MGIGTFGTFTTARLGIYAASKGLSVTGNNIANINTTGYTRQKLDQISLRTGGADRFQSAYDVRVGNGVLCTGVSQLRDPYLDIRYRSTMADVGYTDRKLNGLGEIASIVDEVAQGEDENGILQSQFSELRDALMDLTDQTGHREYDIQVRSTAEALTKQLNAYAARLEELYDNTEKGFQQDIETVNKILNNIRDLNDTIRKSDIHGDPALELRDERNNLIDQLSEYVNIDAVYGLEDIGAGQYVEKLTIKLSGANHDKDSGTTDWTTLIDGRYGAQLSLTTDESNLKPEDRKYLLTVSELKSAFGTVLESYERTRTEGLTDDDLMVPNPDYDATKPEADDNKKEITKTPDELFGTGDDAKNSVTIVSPENAKPGEDRTVTVYTRKVKTPAGENGTPPAVYEYAKEITGIVTSKPVDLLDNDLNGKLQADRELLTEKGEFATDKEITGKVTDGADPNAGTKRGIIYYQKALDLLANKLATSFNAANSGKLSNGQPAPKSGVLFSNNGNGDDTDGITAKNISIAQSWASGNHAIVNSYQVVPGKNEVASTDSSNILHMVNMIDQKMKYDATDVRKDAVGTSMFEGSFQEFLTNMGTVLGNDQRTTGIMMDKSKAMALDLDTSRDGVSGVDLNDEAMNLMQYQKAYTAACRLMTTIDEALDKLVNGTGVVGR